jgi:hypothetical protein
VRLVALHDHDVSQRRRVDGTARARAQHDADLGHTAAQRHVAEEDAAIAVERRDTLLDARATGVEQAHDRAERAPSAIEPSGDLGRVHLAERSAQRRGVLREDLDRATVDARRTRDHAVTGGTFALHAECGDPVTRLTAPLDEAVEIDQCGDPGEPVTANVDRLSHGSVLHTRWVVGSEGWW